MDSAFNMISFSTPFIPFQKSEKEVYSRFKQPNILPLHPTYIETLEIVIIYIILINNQWFS